MPRVTDMTAHDAKLRLEALGLEVRVEGGEDTVKAQLPVVNSTIAVGSEVVLYAGADRPVDPVKVPNLVGKSARQAMAALEKSGLFMKTSGASPSSSSVEVTTQSVSADEEVPYGSIVQVTLVDTSNLGQY